MDDIDVDAVRVVVELVPVAEVRPHSPILPLGVKSDASANVKQVRAAVTLTLALPLLVADLWLKAAATTPPWAYHERSLGWVLMCLTLVPGLVLVTRIPAPLVPPAAGVLLAGVLGNVSSAAWNNFEVPNPILIRGDGTLLAFNLADLYTLVGVILLVSAVCGWLVSNRSLLPRAAARDN